MVLPVNPFAQAPFKRSVHPEECEIIVEEGGSDRGKGVGGGEGMRVGGGEGIGGWGWRRWGWRKVNFLFV